MSHEYVGQTCSWCKGVITEQGQVAICDTCGQPSHLQCWQAHRGCGTPGCTGKISAVLGDEAVIAPVPPATPATPAPKKKKKTGLIIAVCCIAAVLVAALVVGGIFFGVPYINYRQACTAMDNGEYDQAYEMFTKLGDFSDSKTKALECTYQQASDLLKDGEYDEAYSYFVWLGDYSDSQKMANKTLYTKATALLEDKKYDDASAVFAQIPDYKDAADMAQEALYLKAGALLQDAYYDRAYNAYAALGEYKDSADLAKEALYQKAQKLMDDKAYKDAYELYDELDGYQESAEKRRGAILLWMAQAMNSYTLSDTQDFCRTVELESDDYDVFYSTIVLFVMGHEDPDFWISDTTASVASQSVWLMLSQLPSYYEEVSLLQDLFATLDDYYYPERVLFGSRIDLAEDCWEIPFVQGLAEYNGAIDGFLMGDWRGSGYYFDFYENENGGTSCRYDLPWIAEPTGTMYYDIDDTIYYYDDANNNHLAKVFRFQIVDFDTIRVYCYKDGYTYTLYRQ